MCLSPVRMLVGPTERPTLVACRSCRVCRDNRINDLVGRCLAEQSTASLVLALTLTYAGNGPETAVLRYSDVQKFLKSIRKAGLKVRYIVAGEYGTMKARAHWHIILFFTDLPPDIMRASDLRKEKRFGYEASVCSAKQVIMDSRVFWEPWPHGLVYFQQPDYSGFRYVLKYALKSQSEGAEKALGMSKKPPLGFKFFMQMADDMVASGLVAQNPEYSFLDVRNKNGGTRRFWLQGRMRQLFLDRYVTMWRMQYGVDPMVSEWVQELYSDKVERDRHRAYPEWEALLGKIERGESLAPPVPVDPLQRVVFAYATVRDHGKTFVLVLHVDGTSTCTHEGETEWITVNGSGVPQSGLERLSECGRKQVSRWLQGANQRRLRGLPS